MCTDCKYACKQKWRWIENSCGTLAVESIGTFKIVWVAFEPRRSTLQKLPILRLSEDGRKVPIQRYKRAQCFERYGAFTIPKTWNPTNKKRFGQSSRLTKPQNAREKMGLKWWKMDIFVSAKKLVSSGIEPETSCVLDRCDNQLHHETLMLSTSLHLVVLYDRHQKVTSPTRNKFEPRASGSKSRNLDKNQCGRSRRNDKFYQRFRKILSITGKSPPYRAFFTLL